MTAVLVVVASFLAMEPITYATHRWVMHGVGRRLHVSHHRPVPLGRFEANDLYPVMFAALVMVVIAIGLNVAGFSILVPICVGVTIYGAVYALVHDVYIHRRLRLFGSKPVPVLRDLEESHRIHHLYDGEPFGMLLPIVPRSLRDRATRTERAPHRR